MITLYQYPPAFDLPVSVSPFCAKLEAYLRLTGRAYTTAKASPPRSPNGLVPYVARDGVVIADSADIIATLEAEGPALDDDLVPAEIALSAELLGISEQGLYFALLYSRFTDDAGWAHQVGAVRAVLPWFLGFMTGWIRRSQRLKAAEHGCVDDASTYRKGGTDLERVSQVLGDQPFLLGEQPHVVDCSVWANLLHACHTRSPNPLTDAVRADRRLMAYVQRMNEELELEVPAPRYS
jgi:glutathione S-transferase